MPQLNVYKSKGNTVYLGGLGVFRNTTGYIALSYKKGNKNRICHLDKGSNAEIFFSELLKYKE
jgi:hypothetical protein